MATRAKVTSVEALESFRTNLIVYLAKSRPTLDEATDSVLRARTWLESDRRIHWEGQVRRLRQKLQDAQQAVFSAELSSLREVSTAERMAVQKVKRALDEAEAKLVLVKKWNRNFANEVMPIAKQLEKLQSVFTTNLPEAISYLGQAVRTLDDYSGIAPTEAGPVFLGSATESLEPNGIEQGAEAPHLPGKPISNPEENTSVSNKEGTP
ncbi:MAG: hypothetical protein ABIV39_17170 [Verrucomicrobiota bacterium]